MKVKRIEPRRHRGHGGYCVFPGRETRPPRLPRMAGWRRPGKKAIACGEGLFPPDWTSYQVQSLSYTARSVAGALSSFLRASLGVPPFGRVSGLPDRRLPIGQKKFTLCSLCLCGTTKQCDFCYGCTYLAKACCVSCSMNCGYSGSRMRTRGLPSSPLTSFKSPCACHWIH
jgi:hypothetical protein